jgi:hypothetical protein
MRGRSGIWAPDQFRWGLLDARTGRPIDPVTLVSDERIEMTDWELLDFAVQIVRDHLEQAKRKLMSWTSHPGVDPSIWFVGDRGPEWVIVRAARYPLMEAKPPTNWQQIAERCAGFSRIGHFASVSVANADDAFDPTGSVPAMPLWRGHAMFARFEGLTPGPVRPG